jgi:MATE family multidrug resistance protein
MIGWLGEASLGAQQIVMQIGLVVVMIPYGLGGAAAILIGQAIGRDDKELIKSYAEAALLIGLIFMILVAICYYVFPHVIISWFGINIHDPKVTMTINIATALLAVAAISQIFDATRNIATGALRAFQDTKFPMVIGFISSWIISIPIGAILAFVFHLGAPGIRAGFLFGWLFGAIILLRRFYKFITKRGLED